jgi:hypothetical protein
MAILTIKTCTGTHLWSEISNLKPPRTFAITQIFSAFNEGGGHLKKNRPMTEKEISTEIVMWLPEQFLELESVFKETTGET